MGCRGLRRSRSHVLPRETRISLARQSAGRECGTLLWKAFRFAGVDVEELRTQVAAARAGDLDAYGCIVRRFQDMAYGYAYSVLGDFHLAEDAAQDAFI